MSDIPTPLMFVDPNETDHTYRVCLWAAPGQGKSVAAASAPGPILVVNADRPSAYRYARKHYPDKEIREVRYRDVSTLEEVYRYLTSMEGVDVQTIVLDPFSNIYDSLLDEAPTIMMKGRRSPDYQWTNKKLLGFIQSLRAFDVNLVLVAHEKIGGDDDEGKLYPALGGPSLINKVLAEMDIAAHIERHVKTTDDGEEVLYVGQLQPRDNLVCKESASGGALGDRRIADLTRWFEVASEAMRPDMSDVPFDETEEQLQARTLADAIDAGDIATDDPDSPGGQFDVDEARAEAA